ncbi:hypothetical protein [Noviherbaspirillum saxi]|uniref:Uncharacterized protein n=1 Tax=Noviherbaspirillum saxi TaxID=2320863 RepID=A0A3A3GBA4_9BURK|nr:hypothetical protein [Noviherbaspirillum saxi]RJF99475.1 hypothetical protein D3871_13770 [Noviherbaspirillum saxi]
MFGKGRSYTYTKADAKISITERGGNLSVRIDGDEYWSASFRTMNSLTELKAGYYGELKRYPFHNPVKGGLDWSGEGRGCNTLQGWFVIDEVTYVGSTLDSIDLRFEQNCEGGKPSLYGKIHWTSKDTVAPPGPVLPLPSNLWSPPAGVTPAFDSYVYLQSDAMDYIGRGQSYLYTMADAIISVSASGGLLSVRINGNEYWTGEFQTMNTLTQIKPGYYGQLQRYPFHNPVKGGLSWSGEGRGCNTLQGWFAVDQVTYISGRLASIDLRFEQYCEGFGPALHGKIHWVK